MFFYPQLCVSVYRGCALGKLIPLTRRAQQRGSGTWHWFSQYILEQAHNISNGLLNIVPQRLQLKPDQKRHVRPLMLINVWILPSDINSKKPLKHSGSTVRKHSRLLLFGILWGPVSSSIKPARHVLVKYLWARDESLMLFPIFCFIFHASFSRWKQRRLTGLKYRLNKQRILHLPYWYEESGGEGNNVVQSLVLSLRAGKVRMSNKAFTATVDALNEQSSAASVYVISCSAECPCPLCRMTSAEKTGGKFSASEQFL